MQEAEADLQGQPPGATRGLSEAATEASDRLTSAEMCRGSEAPLHYATTQNRNATSSVGMAPAGPAKLELLSVAPGINSNRVSTSQDGCSSIR